MSSDARDTFIHPTSIVEDGVTIGARTKIWHYVHIRSSCSVGEDCNIGKGVFLDMGVLIGNRVKIQNHVSVFRGVRIEDGVFLGPHVCFTNDRVPRAISPDGELKGVLDWTIATTVVEYGASIGANSTILPGIRIGRWAFIGAGSVVTRAVPPYALIYGNPARVCGVVAPSGSVVSRTYAAGRFISDSGEVVEIEREHGA